MEKMKRTNLLVRGFRLALRNWPCVVWAYAVNLIFGLLAGVPFTAGLASYLDHSLAAQRIAGTIDIASLGELGIHLGDSGFFPIVVHTAGWLNLLQLLLLFVLFAGSVFVFVSGEPPRISVLLRGGAAYFFRFVRAAILAGCGGAVVLAILLSLRAALLAQADEIYVGSWMFYCRLLTGAVVLLAGLLIRLWWDLVEVYIVRNAMRGERSARWGCACMSGRNWSHHARSGWLSCWRRPGSFCCSPAGSGSGGWRQPLSCRSIRRS
jgi:hypothetical protein